MPTYIGGTPIQWVVYSAGAAFLPVGLTSLALARFEIGLYPPPDPGAAWLRLLGLVLLNVLLMALGGLFLIVGFAVGSRVRGSCVFGTVVSVCAIVLTFVGSLWLENGALRILAVFPAFGLAALAIRRKGHARAKSGTAVRG